MGEAFLYGNGEQNPLNFRVIGSLVQPAAPKYNDIWVKTSVKIPDWEFSEVNMPSHAMSEGFVYFTSTYNGAWAARESTGLNFLRKHAILTKLTAACQYYSGAWHSMDAYIYKSGTWVQFSWTIVYLYNRGVLNNAVIGGINIVKKGISENGYTRNTPKVTYNSDNFVITNGGTDYNDGGIVHFANKIDLTLYKTLGFEGQGIGGYNKLYIWPSFGTYIPDKSIASIQNTGNLDISALSGAFYIGFGIYGRDSNKVTVYSVSLQ